MNDERWMRRAIALAASQVGRTADNPAVGCVIVKDGLAIGEGATADGGRPHAEERALDCAGARAAGATAYVTLEPCARRTSGAASCADRLAKAGVARVVFSLADPHPNAAGAGPQVLAAAGVQVEAGLLAQEARPTVAAFLQRWAKG